MATIIQMPKPPDEPEEPKVSQLALAECVAIENEIRLLLVALKEKRAYLRERLKDGVTVQDGPLKSFAARIARGRFP
jgi:hypothetical protein